MSRGPIPPRWLECPRKSLHLIHNKFLAIKTPLESGYDDQMEVQHYFHPGMIFDAMKSYKVKIGLWIDLTNTKRFYHPKEIQTRDCQYVKVSCRGHGETPSAQQVKTFNDLAARFSAAKPLEIIVVHCTHGFNRSGFLISAYLIETQDWSPEAAVVEFAKARPPGIYKQDYLNQLFERYGDVEDAPEAPSLPDWCFDSETGVDEDGNPTQGTSNSNNTNNGSSNGGGRKGANGGTFMEGVKGVTNVTEQPLLKTVQNTVRSMCQYRKNGFPGGQPVSMTRENLGMLSEGPYKVSWKPDGTRYLMLIDGKDRIYFVDRDNAVYQVHNLTFLFRKDCSIYIDRTLLDGEMVIDRVNGESFPRFLVYDVIRFRDQEVGKTNFGTRLTCIFKEIINARNQYILDGIIDKSSEPFSIRQKQFWDVSETRTLLGPKFTKESLGHEPDGLIFQPSGEKDVYVCGRDDRVLKWKPHTHNSIDFKLIVIKDQRPGMIAEYIGQLFVGGLNSPFASMKVNKKLRSYDRKIIECNLVNGEWKFMRERTDKSFPNAYATAQGVMKSINEPVTEDILLNYVENHRYIKPDSSLMPPPSMSKKQRLG